MQDQPAYEFEPRIPPNLSIVAFGDVHGCLDKLDPLLERIEERARPSPKSVIWSSPLAISSIAAPIWPG